MKSGCFWQRFENFSPTCLKIFSCCRHIGFWDDKYWDWLVLRTFGLQECDRTTKFKGEEKWHKLNVMFLRQKIANLPASGSYIKPLFLDWPVMESPKNVNSERSPLLHPNPSLYTRSISQKEAILHLSKSRERFFGVYRLYGRRWYVLLVLFVLNVSNAMVSWQSSRSMS